MRNWPYAYALSQDTAKLKGKFKVSPLPEYEGAGTAGILGGANSVISVYSKNPGGALALVDYLSSEEWQTTLLAKYSVPSPLKATYDEPEVQKAIPFYAELREGIEQAKARPVSPVYPQISQAIYKNVNAALAGPDVARGRDEAGAVGHREGARDLLTPGERHTELLVVGGGLGGVAAALAAAARGRRVVLTEAGDVLGGQLTSQAVPPDEHPWIERFGCTALLPRAARRDPRPTTARTFRSPRRRARGRT